VTIPTASVSRASRSVITATYRRDSKPVQIRLFANGALPAAVGGGGGSIAEHSSTVTAFASWDPRSHVHGLNRASEMWVVAPSRQSQAFRPRARMPERSTQPTGAAQTHTIPVNVYNSVDPALPEPGDGYSDGVTLAPGVLLRAAAASNLNGGTLTLTGSGRTF